MTTDKALRAQMAEFLDWQHAHIGFEAAVKGLSPKLRGAVPNGFAHSVWQLVEHMRLAQHDILEFCRNPRYEEKLKWPQDYWPTTPGPRSGKAWTRSLAEFRRDRKAMQRLATNTRIDLFARIPHGTGQTYLRELLLVADHTAHHIGQVIDVRRALGAWR